MAGLREGLSWLALAVLGILSGVLEDVLFILILVPYLPGSLDLTGDLFWVFTVPLAQLLALSLTGTLGWLFLGLRQRRRLIGFWLIWMSARGTFLFLVNNPVEDILAYLAWITLWCLGIGLLARWRDPVAEGAKA